MKTLIISLKIFLILTILTGIIYPVLVTLIAQALFPVKSNGSLIEVNNKIAGSELIGQKSDSIIYFSSRPSAVSYNPMPSGGSNYGLTNTKLISLVAERKKHFIEYNLLDSLTVIPGEMLFASASGLDPHISPQAAVLQVNRIVDARHFDGIKKEKVIQAIKGLTEKPQYLIFGEERINVLKLNIELDMIAENSTVNK